MSYFHYLKDINDYPKHALGHVRIKYCTDNIQYCLSHENCAEAHDKY